MPTADLTPATTAFAGVVGLFVGSFLNVVVYRVPLGLSIVTPRSMCPDCGAQLAWWENIPVASWLALRARCRTCHQAISPRYPLIELATGAAFAAVTWSLHGSALAVAYCGLAATMICVGLIEHEGRRSPFAVAAVGVGLAQLVILVLEGTLGRWGIVYGSLIGTAAASAAYGILRFRDRRCADPRGHGRSALLVAGCWLGGLGPRPAAVGAGVGIAVYLAMLTGGLTGGWWAQRPRSTGEDDRVPSTPPAGVWVSAALVSAIGLAMAASLITAA